MKDIPGYEGLYQITKSGEVWTVLRKKWMKSYVGKSGVLQLNLRKDGKATQHSVHRLVAITYIDNTENKPQVDHIDGNKQNNHVDNLRWCTNEENQQFRWKQGNHGKHAAAKKIEWAGKEYPSIGALARYIAGIRGSKVDTVKKELKAVNYGGRVMYGEWCVLI